MDWALGVRSSTLCSSTALRAADCLPQGGTPPPARPLLTAPGVRSVLFLSISAVSATLICTIVFGIVFFSTLLGRSLRVLSSLERLLRSLGLLLGPPGTLLAASWSLLRGSWGLLGASWAVLEAIQNNKNITCKKRSTSRPPKRESTRLLGPLFGAQNRPKSDPKRVKI